MRQPRGRRPGPAVHEMPSVIMASGLEMIMVSGVVCQEMIMASGSGLSRDDYYGEWSVKLSRICTF